VRVFGLTIGRTKASVSTADAGLASLSTPSSWRSWFPIISEPFTGAWQRNMSMRTDDVLSYSAVSACITLIASDIGKLRAKLVQETSPGIWEETKNPAYSPVLRSPNHYQIRNDYVEQYITSKLVTGNAYVLKERDNRNVVTGLYVLDACRVKPLVAGNGEVFYELSEDPLSGVKQDVRVPASEIIHDVYWAPYHPLCGISPLMYSGLAAVQGLNVQKSSATFFGNGSTPGGILSTPGTLNPEEARNYQEQWEQQFSGSDNAGKVAVLAGDWKYSPLTMSAQDAQLIEQLRWTAEDVCRAFRVPAYMVNVGPVPALANVEALTQQYYNQCLQSLIEKFEAHLDRGLSLSEQLGTELDLEGLLRMDSASRVAAAKESANGGGMTFNEVRKRYHGLGPVPGGDAVLSQQQNFSIEALAKRDARPDPFATGPKAPPAPPPAAPPPAAAAGDGGQKDLPLDFISAHATLLCAKSLSVAA
jgi:HK97 family phage portal protein